MKSIFASICIAVPALCMSVQATPETAAQDAIKGAIVNLSDCAAASSDKDLPTLISEVNTILTNVTPGILTALEPLTNEQKVTVIQAIMTSEEIGKLAEATAPLSESKAAATVMPAVAGEADPMSLTADMTMQTKLQVIDIVANIAKIAIGLGVDTPAVLEMFMGGEEDCPAE